MTPERLAALLVDGCTMDNCSGDVDWEESLHIIVNLINEVEECNFGVTDEEKVFLKILRTTIWDHPNFVKLREYYDKPI